MARTRKLTSKIATTRATGAPEPARLLEEYRRRAGLLRDSGRGPVLPALSLLNRAIEVGLPDPTERELWMDPLRQNWPGRDLLDLLGRAVFHRACDPQRPQRVRDHALVFLAGIVGLNHPADAEPRPIMPRETATHHILGGNWGKPRAWLSRAIEAGNFAVAAEQFALGVRDGALDHSRDPGAFNRQLRAALGGGNTTTRQTRRR